MIELYQFSRSENLSHTSPFCVKLETYLKLAKIPYENKFINNPRLGPKKKLPFIKDGEFILGDSTLIIDHLKSMHGDRLDGSLTAEQRAHLIAFQSLLEESLVDVMMYWRWVDDEGWRSFAKASFTDFPTPLKSILPPLFRRGVCKTLWASGIARHRPSETLDIGDRGFSALSTFLDKKKFFFNETLSTLDVIAFAVIGNILGDGSARPLTKRLLRYPNLLEHTERMRVRAWAN